MLFLSLPLAISSGHGWMDLANDHGLSRFVDSSPRGAGGFSGCPSCWLCWVWLLSQVFVWVQGFKKRRLRAQAFGIFWRCFFEFDNWCFNSVVTRCTITVGIDKVLKDMAPRYEAAYEDSGLENQQSSAELTCKQRPSNLQPKWLTVGSKTKGTYESRSKLPASNIANC